MNLKKIKQKIRSFQNHSISEQDLSKARSFSTVLKQEKDTFKQILSLVRDALSNKITLDKSFLLTLIGTIVYVISPWDVIPDVLPLIGFLDDIVAVAWVRKHFNTIFLTHQMTSSVISEWINSEIEQKVYQWVAKVKAFLQNQYLNFIQHFILEIIFLILCLFCDYYLYPIPMMIFVYSYLALKMLLFIVKNILLINTFLREINFFMVSKFYLYMKETKSMSKAIKLDARNFYNYFYKQHLSSSTRLIHKIGSSVSLIPNNDTMFEKIYITITQTFHLILKKEIIFFFSVVICYIILSYFMRYFIVQIILFLY